MRNLEMFIVICAAIYLLVVSIFLVRPYIIMNHYAEKYHAGVEVLYIGHRYIVTHHYKHLGLVTLQLTYRDTVGMCWPTADARPKDLLRIRDTQ